MNALHNCTVSRVEKIDEHNVVFVIDMTRHIHLRDPRLVEAAMNEYMAHYSTVSAWNARAEKGLLFITVAGSIDWSVLEDLQERVKKNG